MVLQIQPAQPLLTEEQQKSISGRRQQRGETSRNLSIGLERWLHDPLAVLDHGFVRVVDYMGNDSSIVEAARISYGSGTTKKSDDQKLINYLLKHKHTTPFEMCEIKLHCKMPIFVARQWVRHRTASINEYSARYSVLDNEFYIPEVEVIQEQSKSNKQGREEAISIDDANLVRQLLRQDCLSAYHDYQVLLGNKEEEDGSTLLTPTGLSGDMNNIVATTLKYSSNEEGNKYKFTGIARELARMVLPVNLYTQWYWKINLHNLMHFLKLRMDPHAQYEIRQYAEIIHFFMKQWVPLASEAFDNYSSGSVTLSQKQVNFIKDMKSGEDVKPEYLSEREYQEVLNLLGWR